MRLRVQRVASVFVCHLHVFIDIYVQAANG
jgi:hypothetical protein